MTLNFVDEPIYMHSISESLKNLNLDYSYSVLSIDIGILHLGISVSLLDEEYNLIEIIWFDLLDITKFKCDRESCQLNHSKTFTDWLGHVWISEYDFFEQVDYILIERQPPCGLVAVEQLIFSRWRSKAILISPNSMHKYFNIGHQDYDQRKVSTEKIARMFIKNKFLVEQLEFYNRKHDITDSICIMIFRIKKKHQLYLDEIRTRRIMERKLHLKKYGKQMTTEQWFESHRFITN